ncbi:uncharacterized protein LOC111301826 [Durio zibethinus]|uniref:Uncharacterized protein LOC111301826 n=1 Tax=Durio zibethinus TaxID=66656 RepID=A0A6P5ZMK2_DURZI|nr:uncharacterized protein LOC111301826 [Durio zibethinus]
MTMSYFPIKTNLLKENDKGSVKIMAWHPPSHKQASITPLPLPLSSTQFSSQNNMLDPGTKLPKSQVSLSDHMGRRWSNSYDHAVSYDPREQKAAQNYANYRSWNSMEGGFGAETSMIEDESAVSTPPLWRTSPSRSPPRRQNINYRCLSPSSKSQAIARGQRELMEMVSRMPESCYELTLKDLVEQQPVAAEPKQESFAEGRGVTNEDTYKKEKGKKMQNNPKPLVKRSGSINNGGFLLKMVFPISLGSKKKKKNDSNTNHNCKVSPKPMVSDASGKSVDKEWWKKRSGSSESESGGSTMNSGSTKSSRSSSTSSSSSWRSISNSSRRHGESGCLAWLSF